jgi:hypothetical protein
MKLPIFGVERLGAGKPVGCVTGVYLRWVFILNRVVG